MSNSGLIGVTNKILFCVFFWFGLWTIGSNVVTIFELNSNYLVINLIFSLIGSILFFSRTPLDFSDFQLASYSQYDCLNVSKKTFLIGFIPLLFIASLTGIFVYKYHFSWVYFLGGAMLMALGYFLTTTSTIVTKQVYTEKIPEQSQIFELICLILLICVVYYFGHQVDIDDSNYVNLGLGAFRTEGGVFEYDTMIGDGLSPIHLPTYKAHSFELLVGTLAYVLPGNALLYMHVIVPIFFCIILALTLFLINYTLFKHYWIVASVFQLVFVLFCIDSFPSLGAHGFFRLFQGKVEFINIVIPLCILQVIKWNVLGKRDDLVFLFVLVVSSVGLTANAIYLTPLVLGVATLPFLFIKPFDKNNITRLSTTFLPVIYPAIIALLIIILSGIYPSEMTVEVGQLDALFTYFGWNLFGMACVAFLPILPFFEFEKKRTEYLYIYMGAIFFFFFNPLFWTFFSSISGNLPGRVFWTVPFPILFSIPIIGILKVYFEHTLNFKVSHLKCLSIAGLFLMATLGLGYKSLGQERQVKIDWHLKPYRVNYPDFEIAQFIAKTFSSSCTVLLPEEIAYNLTMIENHPYPVAVRNLYLEHYRHTMGKDEVRLRWELMNSLSKKDAYSISFENILLGVDQFGIDVILISEENINFGLYHKAKTNLKFNNQMKIGVYNVYYKDCN